MLGFVPEERPKNAKKYHFPSHCPCPLKTEVKSEEGGVVRRHSKRGTDAADGSMASAGVGEDRADPGPAAGGRPEAGAGAC